MTYLNQYAFFLNKFIPQLSTCVSHHSLLIIITIMRQSKNEVQYNDCIFCEEDAGDSIFFMMNDAIKVKYIENPKESTTSYIDALLRIEAPTNKEEAEAGCMFRQWLVLDDHDEFLKREYKRQEYANKIGQLSQYYKFHNDIPRVVEYGVQKIMGRHYDKKRECDYKRIKKVLKAQQGLSITSVQESSSGFSDSQIVKKSKYSTLLNAISHSNINEHSDSKVLYQLCKEIDKVIPQEKAQPFSVKGSFPEDRMFEYYLKSEQKKLKDRLRERNKVRQGSKVLKKFNYQEFLKSREKATDESKETKQKEEKKPEKEGRFIYNTNVKIEIRNAMFYSQGQNALQIGNFENEFNSKDNRFKKKSAAGKINTNPYRSNQKIAAQIYKSSQHDLRLRNHLAMATQKTTTKENVNISRSKQKRKSTSKQVQPDMKKGLHTLSARKLLHGNEWVLTSKPGRSLSTSSIKKRSTSTGVVGSTSTKKLEQRPIERKAIEGISRYGSSQYKPIINLGKDSKSVSIKELLSRKLKFNI